MLSEYFFSRLEKAIGYKLYLRPQKVLGKELFSKFCLTMSNVSNFENFQMRRKTFKFSL